MLLLLGVLVWEMGLGQLPLFEGTSAAPAGMFYYNKDKAQDQRPRRYIYRIAPDSTSCLLLDFSLIKSPGDKDFVKVWLPGDREQPLATLGGHHQSQLLQVESGAVEVEFLRDGYALPSVWTLRWRAGYGDACLEGGTSMSDCPDVQEICGPEFVEEFQYFRSSQVSSGSEYSTPRAWYRFVAQKDGDLMFRIQPRMALEDLDWELYRIPADSAALCPAELHDSLLVATNRAAGLGPRGATGMDLSGQRIRDAASGNPFSRRVLARKGDQFYLHLLPGLGRHEGFRIAFNDVILQCTNPDRDFLPLGHRPPSGRPQVPPQNQFTRFSRIRRIDLQEKANQPLALAAVSDLDLNCEGSPKRIDDNWNAVGQGLTGLLLSGLKYGRFPAYSAHDHATPVTYGDLVKQVGRWHGKRIGWDAPVETWDPLQQVIELVVEETFDRVSGRETQQIRMVRLVWSSDDPNVPDFNVALIRFEDILPYLHTVKVPNPHNDVASLSVASFLKGQHYSAVTVQQRDQASRNLEEAAHRDARELEFQSFRWDY